MFWGERDCGAVFSYASPEDAVLRRTMIQLIEYMSGRARLEEMYLRHRETLRPEDNVWEVAVRGMGLETVCNEGALGAVPRRGPLVVIANHPFGFIDGLVLCYLMSTIRPDFKVFTNAMMCRVPEVESYMLPIDFSTTRQAAAINARSRALGKVFLKDGGCLIIFPSGAVSTSPTLFAPAVDPEWHPFAGRLIMQCRTAVLPVYFSGQNSGLFQWVSHISLTLRLSLLMRELTRRMGTPVEVRVGDVIPFEAMDVAGGPAALIKSLRQATYGLADKADASGDLEIATKAPHRSRRGLTMPARRTG